MKAATLLLTLLITLPVSLLADGLKPYILAGIDQGSKQEVQMRIQEKLEAQDFEVVGTYAPAEDENLAVICITHELLKKCAAESGGLLGFAAVLRVGLNANDKGVEVSYTNPIYWGSAYFRKDFPQVEETYKHLAQQLMEALGDLPDKRFEAFGSKKGLSDKKLRKYHYMMGMPYFDDVVVLDSDSSYDEAVARIESKAATADSNVEIVYSIKFPEQKMALYGTALSGEKGEQHFLPKIDISEPRHVPFLPYEMLVLEDKVVSLHGRFRIALSFPDLKMGTFMKIMSTPGDIADAQRSIATE